MAQEKFGLGAAAEYWMDAWQRGVLILETLNERGNIQLAQAAKEAPHVLSFPAEVVLDGRTLERPVSYALVRIIPPVGVTIDPAEGCDRSRRPACGPRAGNRRHEARE